jgi:hypothetical protein
VRGHTFVDVLVVSLSWWHFYQASFGKVNGLVGRVFLVKATIFLDMDVA